VVIKWSELLYGGSLPGLSENDHGDIHGYELTVSVRQLLLKNKVVSEKMLSDVTGFKDPFLVGIVTKDNRNYAYFLYAENGDVRLVSSYRLGTNGWVKITK
jgi:hypothetical protein